MLPGFRQPVSSAGFVFFTFCIFRSVLHPSYLSSEHTAFYQQYILCLPAISPYTLPVLAFTVFFTGITEFMVSPMLVPVPGRLSDRIGRYRMLRAALLLFVVDGIALAYQDSQILLPAVTALLFYATVLTGGILSPIYCKK